MTLDPAAGDLADPAFLAINSRGQVPALRLPDGSVVTEIPAILNHLADAHPESGLAPRPGSAMRAQHDRWLAYLHANGYEGALRMYYAERYTTDPAGAEAVRDAAEAYVFRNLAIPDTAVAAGPFLLGPSPMAVDYLLWVLASWLDRDKVGQAAPKVLVLSDSVAAIPGLAAVIARHL